MTKDEIEWEINYIYECIDALHPNDVDEFKYLQNKLVNLQNLHEEAKEL
jgi:myo-inositol catabolism protein IolC